MNTVNLPLALFTVALRRFIDKIRAPQASGVLSSAASALITGLGTQGAHGMPWLIEPTILKTCMYAYMFTVGLYYMLKNMNNGTIVALAKRYSSGALNIKDKCMRPKLLDRRKSWMMHNLSKTRDSQQRALRYVASMSSQPGPSLPRRSNASPLPRNSRTAWRRRTPTCSDPADHRQHGEAIFDGRQAAAPCDCRYRRPTGNDFPVFSDVDNTAAAYGSNPYFEPKVFCNRPRLTTFLGPNSGRSPLEHDATGVTRPHDFGGAPAPRVYRNGDKPANPPISELNDLNSTDDYSDAVPRTIPNPARRRKLLPRGRNCYTLRGRQINRDELNCNGRIVRKTRSGKVYGYKSTKSRGRSRIQ